MEYGRCPTRMVVLWEGTLGLPDGGESVPAGFFSAALFSASLHMEGEKPHVMYNTRSEQPLHATCSAALLGSQFKHNINCLFNE